MVDGIYSIKIERMPSPKCPRCYDRNGVEDNFMGMCGRCCKICLDAAEDFVVFKMLSQEEADRLVNGITEAYRKQKEKYEHKKV